MNARMDNATRQALAEHEIERLRAVNVELLAAAERIAVNALDIDGSNDLQVDREMFNDLCAALAKAEGRS